MRWFAGFVFHKIAFGLLSVLLPLYMTQIVSGGSLTVWGTIASAATFLAIPFSFLWGYLCDAIRRYRFFILMSFAAVTVLLYFFSMVADLFLLGLLHVLIVVFQVAYDPPKNVLIAETYSHEDWKQGFARYETWTQVGWVIGLLLGFLLATSGIGIGTLLFTCVGLSFASFLVSALSVADPDLIFERRLVSIEKSVSLVQRGATLLSRVDHGTNIRSELRQENASIFCVGLVLFSLATSIFFTPLPVFFAANFAFQTAIIFVLFLLNSTAGLIGYLLTQRNTDELEPKKSIRRITLVRGILVLLPVLSSFLAFELAMALSVFALIAMGFVYASYSVAILSLSMEVIPPGRAGMFTALVGTGSGLGCFAGPIIAERLGFEYMFVMSAAFFLLSFLTFKRFK